tara:strand:+ start:1949 stop:2875 length:927 start_codon:yes stop_codon:yes gene_type:complete
MKEQSSLFKVDTETRDQIKSEVLSVKDKMNLSRFEYTEDIKYSIKTYTPKDCQMLLDNTTMYDNTPNNKLSQYINDMSNDNWELTGSPIAIDVNGQVVNGVTRLYAVIESGIPQFFASVENVSPRTINTYDLNSKRTFPDALRFRYREIKYIEPLTVLVKSILDYEDGYYNGNRKGPRNPMILLDFYESITDKELLSHIASLGYSKYYNSSRLLPRKLFIFIYYIFHKSDPELAEKFMDGLVGINLTEDSPIKAFNTKTMMSKEKTNHKLNERYIVRYAIIAWNKFKNNKTCVNLRLPSKEINYTSLI